MTRTQTLRNGTAIAGAVLLIAAAAGCSKSDNAGSDTGSTTAPSVSMSVPRGAGGSGPSDASSDPTAAASTEAPTPLSGDFVVPQQVGAPPYSFLDPKNSLSGLLPDLSVAVGAALGTQTKNEQATFENSLLGLQRGIYQTVPGADVTAERLKTFDFALSVRDSYGFQVPADGKDIADSMDDLCGLSVAVVSGSSPIAALEKQSKACTDGGKPAVTIKTFADWASGDLAVRSGQADAATQPTSTMGYQAAQNPGKWKITGPKYNFVDIGFATKKGDGLAQKISDATNRMIADGKYLKILQKYGIEGMAIEKSVVNPEPKS